MVQILAFPKGRRNGPLTPALLFLEGRTNPEIEAARARLNRQALEQYHPLRWQPTRLERVASRVLAPIVEPFANAVRRLWCEP